MELDTRVLWYGNQRIAYDVRGRGDCTVVLLPGMTLSRRMHDRLTGELTAAGFRVIRVEPTGFGDSDRPVGYWNYSMSIWARQVVALLDELGIERTVLMGTSAGANITLATAVHAPDRLMGIIVDSPVLERATPTCAAVAAVGLLLGTYAAPLTRTLLRPLAWVPRTYGSIPDLLLTTLCQEPRRCAEVLQGIIHGRIMPPPPVRREIPVKTLVIGERFDPLHVITDAREFADAVPDGRFLHAITIAELRLIPGRLAPAITDFITECWESASARPPNGFDDDVA
ncbi:alpha/beta fold hydrolase [Nocardia terpenica]|uniref:Alpha/beta fold hydrolase n=1 Tax=Nocardia terpenica TaxID=455432 RepID=A0A6G9ZCQ3_9NOCA|nr:alpha/beta hydrolase [Nocardia terpenica]QIS23399.1 alpha/beta fold hydrolase [Nocardia terpenica]